MESSQKLFDLLKDLMVQLPTLLVLLVCLIVALVRWKRQPQVSVLVLASLALLFVCNVVTDVVYNWVPDWLISSVGPGDLDTLRHNVYLVLGLASSGVVAVALAWLLIAIFINRDTATDRM